MVSAWRWPSRVVAAFVVVIFAAGTPAHGQAKAEASRVRILLIVDSDAGTAGVNGFVGDLKSIEKVLRETLRDLRMEDRYTLDILRGKDATPSKILGHYRDLDTNPSEVLFCYYSGHGAADPLNGHFLDLEGGQLWRSDLRAAMLAKKTRLVVLVTDSCAEYTDPAFGSPRQRDPESAGRLDQNEDARQPSKVPRGSAVMRGETLKQLLFYQEGIVDISACAIGKQAFSKKQEGGYFTLALVALLAASPAECQNNGNGEVSWASFFALLRARTSDAAARANNLQAPVAFSLGK